MGRETVRAHVVIPEELVREVDELVGPRKRSEFFVEAVREKVRRLRLAIAAERAVGSLADVEIPGWETSNTAAAWVRHSRQSDDTCLQGAAE